MRRLLPVVITATLAVTLPAAGQAAPDPFGDQVLAWGPCTDIPDSEPLECSAFSAPRDWNRPHDGNRITIAISRLKSPTRHARSLLTNPGGPGEPGRTMPLFLATRAKLADNVEIVGIDVRGTGASTNVTCGGFVFPDFPVDPRDRSPRNVDLIYDAAEFQAKTCQTLSGDFGKYVDTEQTVKDLDLLRRLLGRDRIDWLGGSGGSWLGAHYSAYFPGHVGRFVLDANVDFSRTWQDTFGELAMAFERRLVTDYLPWVAKYDSVYHLGATPEAVRARYESVRARLATGGPLTIVELDGLVARILYGKSLFPQGTELLARVVAAVEGQGAAVPGVTAFARYADAGNALFYSIICNDTRYVGGRAELAARAEERGRKYPFVGYHQISAPCAFWHRTPLKLRKPTGKGAPPILLVQSERDPATPIEGARRAHASLAGSRLVTVVDDGDHGVYGSGNRCVDDIVESFVVDGVTPDRDLTCAATPLPTPGTTAGIPLVARR
ncbi:alpha/beta hydrolase [Saccharothrix violaceirubra]|uniref:Pimeloyl-ACP methyl ester carboxylesterase n=1 Tax=Saccharothrix violaceirubra TaxID=413306 RepID=A0A7W7WUC8_9PSEU|nr:alpha/beta hydrolase [Saccharothrix violaceirubra]MBB4963632.1 pimeloyl-ACP methyl ester carboxylesterase [Saccharothrix violaceirubra]